MRRIARLPSHQTPAPLLCWLHADRFTSLISNTRRPCRVRAPPPRRVASKGPSRHGWGGSSAIRPAEAMHVVAVGVRPEKSTRRGESQHKNRAVPQNERGVEVKPGLGGLGDSPTWGFPIGEYYRPKPTARFGGFSVGQLGFCATAPPSSQAPPATPKTPYSPPQG